MTTDFHCYSCGDPITGGVSQTKCLDCLLGIEDDDEMNTCGACDEECEPGEEFCHACQAELDEYDEADEAVGGTNPENFADTMGFLYGHEEDA